jgi:hypothetical protein
MTLDHRIAPIAALALGIATLASVARAATGFDHDDARCHALASRGAAAGPRADPDCQVVLTFATVGDSREEEGASYLTPQDAVWLQNSKVWSRMMREIERHQPELLFFNGDMIMGYGNAGPVSATDVDSVLHSDLVKFHTEYAFWRGMVAPLIENGTYVVPVPGNHEIQCNGSKSTCTDTNGNVLTGKKALKVNEDAWRANMGDLIIDTTRMNANLPGKLAVSNVDNSDHGSLDGLTTPQNQLSYSFDVGPSHFAVISTDAPGADSTAPSAWLAADFSAASARGARHFFVFGHKPAYTYDFSGNNGKAGGLDAIPAKRNAFWSVIEQYGATYFCGHQHTFNMRQPIKADGTPSNAWQVIVGSGGSPFDVAQSAANQQPYDRYYAWANVRVFQSGKVQIDAYGFSDAFGPTRLLQSVVLTH